MGRNPSNPDQISVEIREEEKTRQLRLRRPGEGATQEDPRSFIFQGSLALVDGVAITPHKETISAGRSATITALSKTGPAAGTCDIYWYVNATEITSGDLPYPLADGDLLHPLLDASEDAESVSAHFMIERT